MRHAQYSLRGLVGRHLRLSSEHVGLHGSSEICLSSAQGSLPRWQCSRSATPAGTAIAGAIRGLLQMPGIQEDVGLIGIHHRGKLYELNPRDSQLEWEVDPWGR